MDAGRTATGRPRQTPPVLQRFLTLIVGGIVLLEFARYAVEQRYFVGLLRIFLPNVKMALALYLPVRGWALDHERAAPLLALGTVGLVLALFRWALLVWHNQVVARLSGTLFKPEQTSFPAVEIDLFREIARRPKGATFVGMTPTEGLFGWRWRPVYLSQTQKSMHRHTMGKTGSGKTLSVLWPAVLQDVLDGKGCLVMDAKRVRTRMSA